MDHQVPVRLRDSAETKVKLEVQAILFVEVSVRGMLEVQSWVLISSLAADSFYLLND